MPPAKAKAKTPASKGFKKVKAEVVKHDNPGQPTLYRPEFARLLEHHLSQGGSVEGFVSKLPRNPSSSEDICVATLYNWFKEHPEFLEAKERGNSARLDMYETAARNIVVGIVPPPPKDAPAGTMMTRGNAAMAMFMLANLAPEKYRRPAAREEGDAGGSPDPDNQERAPVINFSYDRLPEPKKKEEE